MGFFGPERRPQIRGGWRCSLCNINFPNDRERFKICPACGDECNYMSNVTVDEDWLDQVADNIMRWEGGDHNTVPPEWEQEKAAEPPEQDESGASEG